MPLVSGCPNVTHWTGASRAKADVLIVEDVELERRELRTRLDEVLRERYPMFRAVLDPAGRLVLQDGRNVHHVDFEAIAGEFRDQPPRGLADTVVAHELRDEADLDAPRAGTCCAAMGRSPLQVRSRRAEHLRQLHLQIAIADAVVGKIEARYHEGVEWIHDLRRVLEKSIERRRESPTRCGDVLHRIVDGVDQQFRLECESGIRLQALRMREVPCRAILESEARGNLACMHRRLEKARVDPRCQVITSESGFEARQVFEHGPHPVVNPGRVRHDLSAPRIGLQRLRPTPGCQQRLAFQDKLAHLLANCRAHLCRTICARRDETFAGHGIHRTRREYAPVQLRRRPGEAHAAASQGEGIQHPWIVRREAHRELILRDRRRQIAERRLHPAQSEAVLGDQRPQLDGVEGGRHGICGLPGAQHLERQAVPCGGIERRTLHRVDQGSLAYIRTENRYPLKAPSRDWNL
jgi:hypothetical protein